MCSKKLIFYAMFLIIISSRLSAAFNFKQDVVFGCFGSEEGLKDVVNEFFRVTKDDLSLKVVGIRYTQEKSKDGRLIGYVATITCHVSTREDLSQAEQKALRNFDTWKKAFSLKKPYSAFITGGVSTPQELLCIEEKAPKIVMD